MGLFSSIMGKIFGHKPAAAGPAPKAAPAPAARPRPRLRRPPSLPRRRWTWKRC